MANKGLVIGVAVLILVGGLAFFGMQKGAPQLDEVKTLQKESAMEGKPIAEGGDVVAVEAPETATDTPAPEPTKVEAPAAEESLLAAPKGLEIDVPKIMEDRVLGNVDAPVTIIEYASMTCPHCAHFHKDIFADVKARLVDTGKVAFIFREYPLDGTAMKASMIARCAPPENFFNLLEVFYRNQDRWIKAEDPIKALAQYAALAGMDETYVNLCINNAELENALLAKINDGQTRYSITQTPTFIFNGGAEKMSGAHPVEKFEEIVNKLSAGK